MKKQYILMLVKELREKITLTQEQYAVEVGITFATVNRWELAKAKPSPLAMRRLEELRAKNKKR